MGTSVRPPAAAKRVVAAVGVLAACAAAAPAMAGAALPDGRAYEQVSPVDKNLGETVRTGYVSDDGTTVMYGLTGMAGDPASVAMTGYEVARRTASGWARTDANAASTGSGSLDWAMPAAFNSDYTKAVWASGMPHSADDPDGTDDIYELLVGTGMTRWLSHGPAPGDDWGQTAAKFSGASTDLRHVFFASTGSLSGGFLADAPNGALYEWADGTLRVASVVDGEAVAGTPAATPDTIGLGVPDAAFEATSPTRGMNTVSRDGRRIFFTSGSVPYVRTDGTSTTRLMQGGGARFAGATPEGDVAYYISNVPQVDGAPSVQALYRVDVDTGAATLLAPGPGAAVGASINTTNPQINTMIAPNGERLYFTATGALTPTAPAGRSLYVWDGQSVRWVTSLTNGRVHRVSNDGRFALILSTASLGGAPNGGQTALYRYDDENGTIVCASCRADGTPSGAPAAIVTEPNIGLTGGFNQPRGLSDDGTVVFSTRDALVPEDTSPAADVYRYRDGGVALISSGTSEYDSYPGDISPDGSSIFFFTRDALVTTDADDGALDLYAARVGGGFAPPPPAPPAGQPCGDGACQGPWPGGLPGAATPSSAPSAGNVPGTPSPAPVNPGPDVEPAATVTLLEPGTGSLRRAARRGRLGIRVEVSHAGTLRARAVARIDGDDRGVGSARRDVGREGVVRVVLRLSRAARRQLRRSGELPLELTARIGSASDRISVTLTKDAR